MTKEADASCSFCAKSRYEVKKLVAGPSVMICNECIELCNEIIEEEAHFANNEPELLKSKYLHESLKKLFPQRHLAI